MRLLVAPVLLRFALPLVLLHPAWEYHRDELLYFAMGDHLAWRMQFPPLIAVVARVGDALFGDAVWVARVPAAAAGAALTGVVLWLVRRLGGGTVGMLLAWIACSAPPCSSGPAC
jgi:4-amino-4-deoxy-L-arabinose transferase-like glycosyltransferase